jgi:hypothetical protein
MPPRLYNFLLLWVFAAKKLALLLIPVSALGAFANVSSVTRYMIFGAVLASPALIALAIMGLGKWRDAKTVAELRKHVIRPNSARPGY